MPDVFTKLVAWYREHARDLPWRRRPTPYRVWISEIMLQQTRVETVAPYFERFLQRFPDVEALAAAELDAVLKLWEGLGYYSRARNLHRAAKVIVSEHDGRLPTTSTDLAALPGFGAYTAAAVASIAFGEPAPVVDGNVLRVASRFWAITDDLRESRVKTAVRDRLQPLIGRSGDPSAFNQAMMELGATICRPQAPDCIACPLTAGCAARRTGRIAELPNRGKAAAIPHYVVAVAVVRNRDGRYLLQQRLPKGMLGGLWEWPGGKVRPGEDLEEVLTATIARQTGIRIAIGEQLTELVQVYSHFRITLKAFAATVCRGRRHAVGVQATRWCRPTAIGALALGKAALDVCRELPRMSAGQRPTRGARLRSGQGRRRASPDRARR